MKRLEELLAIEDLKERQDAIKKSFMLYTEPVQVDGFEEEVLVILLNLAQSKPTCKNYLDEQRAKSYFASEGNHAKAVGETQWVHTHNLKYPDSRVKDQRIIAPSSGMPAQLGWAHNSGTYPHTIWLLNSFSWQSEETCMLREIVKHTQFWFDLLEKFGLAGKRLDRFVHSIENNVPESSFPEAVDLYSKQVRFPYQNDYLSITPVVSHGMQQELERLARQDKTGLRFTSVSLPHPASIGNLCGSIGGHMRLLHYPMNVRERSSATLLDSRIRSGKYCDDYQLTNKTICGVLGHLAGNQSQITKVKQAQLRKHQLRILRKQIALWLLPLIELKERYNESSFKLHHQDDLVARFISSDIKELGSLTKELNQRIHFTLQENKFSNRYAYHQKLVQPIRAQLEWVLQQLSLSEKEEDLTSSEQYLYLCTYPRCVCRMP